MLSHDDLLDAFGEDGVTRIHFDDALALGMSELNALILSHVGLPSDVGTMFTTEFSGAPGIFSVQALENNAALFIGAPGDKQDKRYFLDVNNDVVVLCSLDDTNPVTEVVNSSLSNFADFVHRLGVWYWSEDGSRDEQIEEVAQLAARLRERDPFAFRHPHTWWSMVLETLKEQAA